MSNIGLIIEEKAADLGNFLVGRLLPFREKRSIGPFVFIDHMGPNELSSDENLDVPPHPHIGLSTLTYLLEGSIMHRDSLGNELEIKPGSVNWMTAGKGVVHSERSPEYLRKSQKKLHGFQIWVGLPKQLEDCNPSFYHIEDHQLPEWEENSVNYKLIAGEIMNKKSQVPVYTDLYFLEIKSSNKIELDLGSHLYGEVGMYILDGNIIVDGNTISPKQIIIAKDSKLCKFEILENTTIYLFGGTPFEEERHIFWNFVHSNKDKIDEAKLNWIEQNYDAFPKVINDNEEFVPLPNYFKK